MVMVLTVVFLLGGSYLLLLVLELLLKWKSGSREKDGLAELFISTQAVNNQASNKASELDGESQNDDSTNSNEN